MEGIMRLGDWLVMTSEEKADVYKKTDCSIKAPEGTAAGEARHNREKDGDK